MNQIKTPQELKTTNLMLKVVAIWQILLGLSLLAVIIWFWQNAGTDVSAVSKALIATGGMVAAIASLAASWFIFKRNHAGRFLSLLINYLGFLAAFFLMMHYLDLFIGLNSLAAHLPDGLIYFVLMLVGYVITTIGDRYETKPNIQRLIHQIGIGFMIIFAVIGLYAIDTIQGLVSLLSRFKDPLPLAFAFGALVFGVMIWMMWRKPSADAMGGNNAHSETLSGYLFLSPNLLGFLFFFAGPLIFSLYISFTNADAFSTPQFVGFENYAKILNVTVAPLDNPQQVARDVLDMKVFDELSRVTIFGKSLIIGAEDKLFWISLRNTIFFVLMAVPVSVIPALVLANLLNTKLPGMKFFRAAYFVPSVAAVVGISLIWQLLYNATIGYINYFIAEIIQFINSFGFALVDPQVRWLSDSRTALIALMIMSAWQWTGFNTVLFLAGLQGIPKTLYEAAEVDGAGRWSQFWNITIPSLAPTTFFVVTTATIQAMQLFDQVFILMNPPAGPNNSTLTIVLYLYQNGFQRFQQGYASAIAWVLFAAIFFVTLLQFQRQRADA